MESSSINISQQVLATQQHILVHQGSIVHQSTGVHQAPVVTTHHQPILVHHELQHVLPHINSTTHHQDDRLQNYKQEQQQFTGDQYRKQQHQTQQQQQQTQQQQHHFQSNLQQHENEDQQTSFQQQLQQRSTVKNDAETVNPEDLSESESLNQHCLVCNTRLWVLSNGVNNGVYDLFAEKTRTSHRRVRAVAILEGVVKEELVYAPLHSTMICKRCFRLIDQIDEIEVTLVDKREDLSNLYYKTKAQNSKEPLENAKDTDAHTGDTLSCGKGQTVVGQVMLDMRSGKLVMHRDLTKENNPSKKVSSASSKKEGNNNDDEGVVYVEDNYDIHSGPPDDNDYESLHMDEDSQQDEFICRLCDMSFKRESLLNKHMKSHDAATYQCRYCEMSFDKAVDLQIHMDQQHARENTGKMKIRKNEVSSNSHQRGPIKASNKKSVDKTYSCPICEQTFTHRKELSEHRLTHAGEKPFQCDICGSFHSQKGNLLTHKRITHMKEKRFKCDICDKSFKWKRILVGHVMSVHTGERPYKCEHCDGSFVYPQHYKKHMRIHTGEKPYNCDICGKTFNCSNNCNAHLFTHTDKKQFECLLCSAGFMRRTQILSHIKQHGHIIDFDQYFKVNTPADVIQGIVSSGSARTAAITEHGSAATAAPVLSPPAARSIKMRGSGGRKHQISAQLLTTVSDVDHRVPAQTSATVMPHNAITATVMLPASTHATTVTMPTITLPAEHSNSHTRSTVNNVEVYDMPVIFIDSDNSASRQVSSEAVSGQFLGTGGEQVLTQHYTTLQQHSKDHW